MACIILYENMNHQNKTVKWREKTSKHFKKIRKLEVNLVETMLIFNNLALFRMYLLMI